MPPVAQDSVTTEYDRLLSSCARSISVAIGQVCGRRNRGLVPDIEQEVRLIVWKRLSTGGPIRNARSYLYKIALTTALAMVSRVAAQDAGQAGGRGRIAGPRGRRGRTLPGAWPARAATASWTPAG